ncbi:MAG: helix-hairpin-helix domain-containing protein [Dehalococcoidales bacterium]|nr:MAG: helix-hairpin-helix domain-containing protein [Dehalococcoidales bacterium]
MEVQDRLETLVTAAQFDVCSYSGVHEVNRASSRFIFRATLPGGGSMSLFKVLLTNVCTNDCAYCANQMRRDIRRISFLPEELAKIFMQLHSKRMVQGLFLSSGVAGNASRTMESMIKTVAILRHRYQFQGYIHLKILPGASFDYVEEGCRLATRVSVNMEAPTIEHLARLSSRKDLYQGILEPMHWVKKIKAVDERLVPSGQTTQFVVGAAGETDRDILRTSSALYNELELRRVYFSAFRPVKNSPLEGQRPTPPLREHRLYQTDWLLRVYGFTPAEVELALGKTGNLSLGRDPKLTIAQRQPWLFPVDVNIASYDELLRVPGIGPTSAKRIIETRRDHSIYSVEQLRKMRVSVRKTVPYIWFQGMLTTEKETQLSFIPEIDDIDEPKPTLAAILG